jgi:hypothetical protein
MMLRLSCKVVNQVDTKGFVKMSAFLSLVEMKQTTRFLDATLSQTKWKLISMCLVQA